MASSVKAKFEAERPGGAERIESLEAVEASVEVMVLLTLWIHGIFSVVKLGSHLWAQTSASVHPRTTGQAWRLELPHRPPGSVRTSLAWAMSMNFFSAFFFSSGSWKLSGCHCWASFRYALIISFFWADLARWDGHGQCNTRVNATTQQRWAEPDGASYLLTPRIL